MSSSLPMLVSATLDKSGTAGGLVGGEGRRGGVGYRAGREGPWLEGRSSASSSAAAAAAACGEDIKDGVDEGTKEERVGSSHSPYRKKNTSSDETAGGDGRMRGSRPPGAEQGAGTSPSRMGNDSAEEGVVLQRRLHRLGDESKLGQCTVQEHILRHRQHFGTTDATTHSVVVAYDTAFVDPMTAKHFAPEERGALREEALGLYRHQRQAQQRRELEQQEMLERQDYETDMSCFFEAFIGWQREIRENLFGKKTLQRAIRRLQERLDDRRFALEVVERQDEEEMKVLGREAWRHEVEETRRLEAEANERERLRQERERLERRAQVFLMTEESRARTVVEAEAAAAHEDMLEVEKAFILECERAALEAFRNSPEQLAIAAAQAKKEKKARLRAAKAKKAFEAEQKKLVTSCTHGPKNGSVFVGPKAREVCPRCRVRWDAELMCYVSMDATAAQLEQRRRSIANAHLAGSPPTVEGATAAGGVSGSHHHLPPLPRNATLASTTGKAGGSTTTATTTTVRNNNSTNTNSNNKNKKKKVSGAPPAGAGKKATSKKSAPKNVSSAEFRGAETGASFSTQAKDEKTATNGNTTGDPISTAHRPKWHEDDENTAAGALKNASVFSSPIPSPALRK